MTDFDFEKAFEEALTNKSGRPGFLTVEEVAARLRISKQVVYRLVKNKDEQFPAIRVGRQYRIFASVIDKLGSEPIKLRPPSPT